MNPNITEMLSLPALQNPSKHNKLRISKQVGQYGFLLDDSENLYLFDIRSKVFVASLELHAGRILAIADTRGRYDCDTFVCTRSEYFMINHGRSWSDRAKPSFEIEKRFQLKEGGVTSAAFTSRLSIFPIGTHSGGLVTIDHGTGTVDEQIDINGESQQSIDWIATNTNDPEVASIVTANGTAIVLDIANPRRICQIPCGAQSIGCAFQIDSVSRFAVLREKGLKEFAITGFHPGTIEESDELRSSISFTSFLFAKNGTIYTGHSNGAVSVWKCENSKYEKTSELSGHSSAVNSILCTEEGALVSCGSREIIRWNF